MSLFKNKYRIESTRLNVWDYPHYGFYFVTICTKDKKELFGYIKEEIVFLNDVGKLVKDNWLIIPSQFKNVELDEFIIMPNHIHGIIFINKDSGLVNPSRDLINQVSTKKPYIKNNPMLTELSLGKIIRWFKAKTS